MKQPSTVVSEFLDRAVLHGEKTAGEVRLLVVVLAMLIRLGTTPIDRILAGEVRFWLVMGVLLVGAAGSVWSIRQSRAIAPPRGLLWLSVSFDHIVAFGAIMPIVAWPQADYPGLLHNALPGFFLITIMLASLRLNRQVQWLAIGLSLSCMALLLGMERQHMQALLPIRLADWLVWGAVFAGTAALADGMVVRTRRLVVAGSEAALKAERARMTLGVYVSEEIADVAMASELLRPGGERREVAILFSDLRGFTRYSENLPPERLVAELNAYLSAMVAVISSEQGVVDKYIGDAIMVVFGIPRSLPDAAARAIRTAATMQQALTAHNLARAEMKLPPLKQGIGVHYGEVVVGNIGTDARMQYTVVGDAVNLASRLESATKTLGAPVLISAAAEAAARGCGASIPPMRSRGTIPIRGREEGVEVFALQE